MILSPSLRISPDSAYCGGAELNLRNETSYWANTHNARRGGVGKPRYRSSARIRLRRRFPRCRPRLPAIVRNADTSLSRCAKAERDG